MVAIGIVVIILAAANAIFLGWLGNRGVQTFDEAAHVSILDLQVLERGK